MWSVLEFLKSVFLEIGTLKKASRKEYLKNIYMVLIVCIVMTLIFTLITNVWLKLISYLFGW